MPEESSAFKVVKSQDEKKLVSEEHFEKARWRTAYMRSLLKSSYFETSSREELPDLIPGTKVKMPVEFLKRNEKQPRIWFDEKDILELSNSIKIKGDVNKAVDITIRKDLEGKYFGLIIGGERRWRATKKADLTHIICMIHPPMNNDELYVLSVTDNMGEKPLTPIEEALAITNLEKEFGWSDARIADVLAKSPATVLKTKRYLDMLPEFQEMLLNRQLTKAEALILAKWHQDNQQKVYAIIQELKEKNQGKSIHPNDLDLLVRREAEKIGLRKVSRAKRGRKGEPSADLTIKKIVRGAISFKSLMELAGQLTKEEALGAKINIVDVIGHLEETKDEIKKILNKLNKWE